MYEELIKALREHAKQRSDCDSCPFHDSVNRGYLSCSAEMAVKAADAIEELSAKYQMALDDLVKHAKPPKEEI